MHSLSLVPKYLLILGQSFGVWFVDWFQPNILIIVITNSVYYHKSNYQLRL